MVMLMVPEELAGSFNGVLLGPADAGYDDARAVHNGLRSFVGGCRPSGRCRPHYTAGGRNTKHRN